VEDLSARLRSRVASPLGALTLIAIAVLVAAQTYHYLLWNFDDPYIIFVMMRRVLAGEGWTFNIGDVHNPSTSVLNPAVVTLGAKIASADVLLTSHYLAGTWIGIAAIGFTWLFWQRFPAWVALLAAVALITQLADGMLWGMETHVFFCVLALFLVAEQRGWNSWFWIGLLTLARPDAMLFAVLRVARGFARWPLPATPGEWKGALAGALRQHYRGVLIFLAVLAPWVVYSLIQFHQLFPDTLSNKIWQGRSGYWGTGPVYLKALISHIFGASWWLGTGYALALPGALFLIRDRSVLLYPVIFVALQQAAYVVLNVPGYHWYFAILDSTSQLVAVYAIGSVWALGVASSLGPARRYVHAALYVAVLFKIGLDVRTAVASQARDGRDEAYQRVAAALREADLPPGPIAAVEVATVAYYLGNHQMLDISGLVTANPQFITGENNDRFFANPPPTVLFHLPIWGFERALHDDLRFKMMYDAPTIIPDPAIAMQYFRLKPGARAPTPEDIAAYVQQQYTRFQLESAGPLVDAAASADALCALDEINGQLAGPRTFELSRTVLGLRGWAFDRSRGGIEPEIFAMLTSGARRYAMKATRVPRPDVAAAYKAPERELAGYELNGSLVDLPAGDYRISILQKRGAGYVTCGFENVVKLQ
jgi:hypothetical protein